MKGMPLNITVFNYMGSDWIGIPFPARLDASAALTREPSVHVAINTLGSVVLMNKSTTSVTVNAGELMGFNTGTFAEIPSGLVAQ